MQPVALTQDILKQYRLSENDARYTTLIAQAIAKLDMTIGDREAAYVGRMFSGNQRLYRLMYDWPNAIKCEGRWFTKLVKAKERATFWSEMEFADYVKKNHAKKLSELDR